MVIRNKGEAWENPFVVVYEPFNEKEKPTIKSVLKIEQNAIYKGLKIESNTPSNDLIQYVITQSKGEVFNSEILGIYFKGTFAVITLNQKEELKSIYIGEGEKMIYKNKIILPSVDKAFYKEY